MEPSTSRLQKPPKNRLVRPEVHGSSGIPVEDWDHFDDFDISVLGEGAESCAGAQHCNIENGDLAVIKTFGASDKSCFASTKNHAVVQGDDQSGHSDCESPINTANHLFLSESLLSERKEKSTKPTEGTGEKFSASTGQCISIYLLWVGFVSCVLIQFIIELQLTDFKVSPGLAVQCQRVLASCIGVPQLYIINM